MKFIPFKPWNGKQTQRGFEEDTDLFHFFKKNSNPTTHGPPDLFHFLKKKPTPNPKAAGLLPSSSFWALHKH